MRGLLEKFAGKFDRERIICMILAKLFRFKLDIFSTKYFFSNAPLKNTQLTYIDNMFQGVVQF